MDSTFDAPPPPPAPPPVAKAPRLGGVNRRTAMVVTTIGLLTGGVAGGYIVGHAASSSSATPTPSTGTGTGPGTDANGTFHSNESASHEAGESAQREAQENAGQVPTVP